MIERTSRYLISFPNTPAGDADYKAFCRMLRRHATTGIAVIYKKFRCGKRPTDPVKDGAAYFDVYYRPTCESGSGYRTPIIDRKTDKVIGWNRARPVKVRYSDKFAAYMQLCGGIYIRTEKDKMKMLRMCKENH